MSIEVRPALERDAEDLMHLNQAFNGVLDRTPEQIARCLRENPQEKVFLSRVDGEAAGFLCIQILRSFCYNQAHGLFAELYVAERFRRQGVASALLQAGEQALAQEGVESVSLETGSENHQAQKLYEAHGYVREDEWVYHKCLK